MRMFSPGAPLTGAMSSPANTALSPRARDQVLKVSTIFCWQAPSCYKRIFAHLSVKTLLMFIMCLTFTGPFPPKFVKNTVKLGCHVSQARTCCTCRSRGPGRGAPRCQTTSSPRSSTRSGYPHNTANWNPLILHFPANAMLNVVKLQLWKCFLQKVFPVWQQSDKRRRPRHQVQNQQLQLWLLQVTFYLEMKI